MVGQRTAVQAEHDERHQLDDAEDADGEVGAGQMVELVGHRDVRHHAAEVGDGAAIEEQAEVARLAQGSGVEPEP